jgi:nucleotide sugar dehydrogenase
MRKAGIIQKDDIVNPRKRKRITVSVLGCDRTSLTIACLLADSGFQVSCIDSDPSITDRVRRGKVPFAEPDLEPLLRKNVEKGRLSATTDIKEPISNSSIILLFVSSMVDKGGRYDHSNIEKVTKEFGLNLQSGTLVISNSNLAPGMTETLIRETLEMASGLRAGVDFGLAHCLIRIVPGKGLQDAMRNPKVFGAVDKKSSELTRAFLSTITKGELIELSDMKTAEAVRLFESVYHEANTALANQLARFCEKTGIDFVEARNAANMQPHCQLSLPGVIAKHDSDNSYILMEEAEVLKVKLRTVKLAKKINEDIMKQVFYLVRDAVRSCGRPARRARVLVLGASSQPNLKEINNSFVMDLVEFLRSKGLIVKVYDPLFSRRELTEFGYPVERTLTKSVKGTDCLLVAVGHDRFKRLNLRRIKLLMRNPPSIVDMSNIIDPVEVEKGGFVYRGLGRGVWTR